VARALLGRWCKWLVCGLGGTAAGNIAKNTKPLLCGDCNMLFNIKTGMLVCIGIPVFILNKRKYQLVA